MPAGVRLLDIDDDGDVVDVLAQVTYRNSCQRVAPSSSAAS
jgi:hypothetical protein